MIVYTTILKNGSTKRFIARRYGSSELNLYNWLKLNWVEKIRFTRSDSFVKDITQLVAGPLQAGAALLRNLFSPQHEMMGLGCSMYGKALCTYPPARV